PGAPDMVKAFRDQSQDAPRRFNCSMIVSPDSCFQAQIFCRNASRPMSRRPGSWRSAMRRSTTIWVAMPAWSWPGCHSVSKPRIRCQRTRMSCSVLFSAWPICRLPVTFGGGITTEKLSAPGFALAPAAKAFLAAHSRAIRASAVCASKFLSMAMVFHPLNRVGDSEARAKGQEALGQELRCNPLPEGKILKPGPRALDHTPGRRAPGQPREILRQCRMGIKGVNRPGIEQCRHGRAICQRERACDPAVVVAGSQMPLGCDIGAIQLFFLLGH